MDTAMRRPGAQSSAFSRYPHHDVIEDPHLMYSTSASTSSSSPPDNQAWKQNVHIRQNFIGYLPPDTRKLPLRAPPSPVRTSKNATRFHPVPVVSPENPGAARSASPAFSDVPFDMMNDLDKDKVLVNRHRDGPKNPRGNLPRAPLPVGAGGASSVLSPTRTAFESVWESSPEREPPANDHTGFSMKPPKFSDPSPLEQRPVLEVSAVTSQLEVPVSTEQEQESSTRRERGRLPYRTVLRTSVTKREPSYEEEEPGYLPIRTAKQYTLGSQSSPSRENKVSLSPISLPTALETPEDEEDLVSHEGENDSLFDFGDEIMMPHQVVEPRFQDDPQQVPANITHKMRRKSRQNRTPPPQLDPEQDESSLGIHYGATVRQASPTTLQERTQQAWKSRRQKSSNLRSKQDAKKDKPKGTVSFGVSDTVHHFMPDPAELEIPDDTFSDNSYLDDRSLNSEYTKGTESEVEDMIKDMLFMGDGAASQPGRRKIKYKPEMRRRLLSQGVQSQVEKTAARQQEDFPILSSYGDSHINSNGNSSASDTFASTSYDETFLSERNHTFEEPRSRVISRQLVAAAESDPFSAVWSFVEDGVTVVSSALGLKQEDEQIFESRKASKRERSSSRRKSCSGDTFVFEACTGDTREESESPSAAVTYDFIDYAQELWDGNAPNGSDSYDMTNGSGSLSWSKGSVDDDMMNIHPEGVPFSISDLENDPRLKKLSVQAARAFHQVQGYDYDESAEIDLHNDVMISVVELKLPLGIIFLENDSGCFVTKVSSDGSAARSGGVEVGDQLASMNGTNAIKLTVDDICLLLKQSPDPKCVELVFLRYIGPMRIAQTPTAESYPPATLAGSRARAQHRQLVPRGKQKKGFRWFGRIKKKGAKVAGK